MINLSIIIPVYNVQEYLEECLESIFNDLTAEVEVLLINDGSTDKSREICIKYVARSQHIHLIDKKNGGLSDARNTGIKNARGKYLMFIDSDDLVCRGGIKKILDLIKNENIDLIIGDYMEYFVNPYKLRKCIISKVDKNVYRYNTEELNRLIKRAQGLWPAWKNIVNKNFIIDNNLLFKKGYLHEDVDWTTKLLVNAKEILYTDLSWYHYRLNRKGSIMSSLKGKSLLHTCKIVDSNYKYIEDLNINQKIKDTIKIRLTKTLYTTFWLYNKCSKEEKEEILNIIYKNRNIINMTDCKQHKIFLIISNIIGLNQAMYLYSYYRSLKY